jgi:hypothetical protein
VQFEGAYTNQNNIPQVLLNMGKKPVNWVLWAKMLVA